MYEPVHAELGNLMRAVPDQLRNLNEATVSMCTQRISSEINKDIKNMQVNLTKALKDNIKMEVCWVYFIYSYIKNTSECKIMFSRLCISDQKRFRNASG